MSIRPSSVIPDLFRDLGLFRVKSRHPGLVPGPIQKGRDLKTTTAGCFIRSRINASHFPGRRMGISLGDFGTTSMLIRPCSVIPDSFRDLGSFRGKSRHPGLAPGPIQKGRHIKTTTAGCFLGSRISLGRFRDDGRGLNRNHLITACGFGVV